MELNNFLLFAFASLMLNLTPGSDMLYVATRSTSQGIQAGVISALGIMAGCFVHTFAAAAGLSIILAQSAVAFSVVKYLGAGYLMWLAYKSFRSRLSSFDVVKTDPVSKRKIFVQGLVTNVLNPKVALFFLAFLPQFVDPASDDAPYYILLLGIWFNLSGTIVNVLVAVLFGKMGNWMSTQSWFVKWQHKVTGFFLFVLGLKIAFAKNVN